MTKTKSAVLALLFSLCLVSTVRADEANPVPAPAPAPGTRMDFNPCPAPGVDYEMRRLPESHFGEAMGPLRDGSTGHFFVLDCSGDPNLHLVHGILPVAGLSEVGWFRSPARAGFQVLRSTPRSSEEALFWGEGEVIISRGVAAPQFALRDEYGRPPLSGGEDAPAPRRRIDAVGNDHYALYVAPAAEGSGCAAGQWELKLAHLRARWLDGWSAAESVPLYEPQPTRALGVCLTREEWEGMRWYNDSASQRTAPSLMDFRWEDDDNLTVLVQYRAVNGDETEESLMGVRINVADGTASVLYRLSGAIDGYSLFPHGCGQYAIAARLAGNTVAILSRRPRALLIDVSDPANLRASVPFIMSASMYTCEGGGMSFNEGRPRDEGGGDNYSQIIVAEGPWNSTTIHWISGHEHWTIPAFVER